MLCGSARCISTQPSRTRRWFLFTSGARKYEGQLRTRGSGHQSRYSLFILTSSSLLDNILPRTTGFTGVKDVASFRRILLNKRRTNGVGLPTNRFGPFDCQSEVSSFCVLDRARARGRSYAIRTHAARARRRLTQRKYQIYFVATDTRGSDTLGAY